MLRSANRPPERPRPVEMSPARALAISIGAVATAAVIGASFGPQQPRAAIWYASLNKPAYTPPGRAIGVTWGVLETLLCFTGFRLLAARRGALRDVALAGWVTTLAGLAGFPALFFGARNLGASTRVATGMVAATATTTAAAARLDAGAALGSVPLLAWTTFASLLSVDLLRRN
jgi:tryptophan-rich sensory protein